MLWLMMTWTQKNAPTAKISMALKCLEDYVRSAINRRWNQFRHNKVLMFLQLRILHWLTDKQALESHNQLQCLMHPKERPYAKQLGVRSMPELSWRASVQIVMEIIMAYASNNVISFFSLLQIQLITCAHL